MTNSELKMYKIYQKQGWRVIKSGFPDFFLWRHDKEYNSYEFCWKEIKKEHCQKLSPEQENVFFVFKKLGFPISVDFSNDYFLNKEGIGGGKRHGFKKKKTYHFE